MALILAVPRIRAAEHIESILRGVGIDAEAISNVTGAYISITVMARGQESDVAQALSAANIQFDRHAGRPQDYAQAFYDCGSGMYNTTVVIVPHTYQREAA